MKVAVMQPYFVPYIGYFRLINAVDKFVLLDDVNYINRGWINRNRILLGERPHTITIPLKGASQNKKICDHEVDLPARTRKKLERTIDSAYRRAPYYAEIRPITKQILECTDVNLADFLYESLIQITGYLNLDTNIVRTSRVYENSHLRGQRRILDICEREAATEYLNAPGGRLLYSRDEFDDKKIGLSFVAENLTKYSQYTGTFVANLSILDTLMFNSKEDVLALLSNDALK